MSIPDVSSIASSIFKQAASSLTDKISGTLVPSTQASSTQASSTQTPPKWAATASSQAIATAQLTSPTQGSPVHHGHHRNDADANATQATASGTPSSSATNDSSIAGALDITT